MLLVPSVYKALTWSQGTDLISTSYISWTWMLLWKAVQYRKRNLSTAAWLILLSNLTHLGGKNLSWRIDSIFRNTCGNIFLIAVWGKRAQSTVGGPLSRQLGLGCIKWEPVSNPANRGPYNFCFNWASPIDGVAVDEREPLIAKLLLVIVFIIATGNKLEHSSNAGKMFCLLNLFLFCLAVVRNLWIMNNPFTGIA